jgi:hypothetical protein
MNRGVLSQLFKAAIEQFADVVIFGLLVQSKAEQGSINCTNPRLGQG